MYECLFHLVTGMGDTGALRTNVESNNARLDNASKQ